MTWIKLELKTLLIRCAAFFAAHFVSVVPVIAEDVTFRSVDDAVVITGTFVGFDGDAVTVLTNGAPVSFRAGGMVCEGSGCPDLEDYVPQFRLAGASRMGDILVPALIDVYARDNGWTVREDAEGFRLVRSDGTAVMDILVRVQPLEDAFASFLRHETDGLLALRELRAQEIEQARTAGLGRVTQAGQARILALDALIPVLSPTMGQTSISLAELTRAFSDPESPLSVILPTETDGQMQGFEDRFMRPFGLRLADPQERMSAPNEIVQKVASAANALSLVPYGQTGPAQPLTLDGPCGLQSKADFLALKTEDYPLTFPMFLYLPQRRQHPQIDAFLDWLRSPSAQLVIRRAGFVDLAAVPIPLSNQGDRLANAIASAGTEVPLTELQRMVRVMSPRVRMSSTFRFEPGSTRLDGQSRSNVMQLAQAIRDGRFGGREVMFVGFSDGRGPAAANRDLSAARAEAVKQAVERALGGVFPSNVGVEIEAFGEALPMACDDTIWGQQINRRVELWVSDAR